MLLHAGSLNISGNCTKQNTGARIKIHSKLFIFKDARCVHVIHLDIKTLVY